MVYIYPEKNLSAYPGAQRGTDEWNYTYKIRSVVEKDIDHFKDSYCLAGRRTQNEKTLVCRPVIARHHPTDNCCTADKIDQNQYLRSTKPLIA
jgi:hypothetical protein